MANIKQTNEDKYRKYFEKVNSLSPINMVAWLNYKNHRKRRMVILSKLNASLHVINERGHKDEYRFYGP